MELSRTSHPVLDETWPHATAIAGLSAIWSAFGDLAAAADLREWNAPTRCEGWAVRDVAESAVTARVGIGSADKGPFGLAVELITELPGIEAAAAETLVTKAHQTCPYSNATRGNIEVAPTTIESSPTTAV